MHFLVHRNAVAITLLSSVVTTLAKCTTTILSTFAFSLFYTLFNTTIPTFSTKMLFIRSFILKNRGTPCPHLVSRLSRITLLTIGRATLPIIVCSTVPTLAAFTYISTILCIFIFIAVLFFRVASEVVYLAASLELARIQSLHCSAIYVAQHKQKPIVEF